PPDALGPPGRVFERSVFELLLRGLSECWPSGGRSSGTSSCCSPGDVLKVAALRLLVHLVSPASAPEQRLFAVHTAWPPRIELVTYSAYAAWPAAVACRRLGTSGPGCQISTGLLSRHAGACPICSTAACGTTLVNLLNVLREAGAESADDPPPGPMPGGAGRLGQAEAGAGFRLGQAAGKLSHLAMDVTRLVVAAQNAQRKRLLDDMKVRLASNVDVKRRWLNLATQLTHEQAVWHRPSSDVPPSWQIDPTEGPSRVRVRLKRCHTGLAAKFFKQSAKWKATWDPAAGPLAFLFREDRLTEDASATLFQLHRNDKIRLNRRCLSVAASAETPGEFLIGERCMYFVGDDTVWDASQAQLPPDAAAELQLPKLAAAAWYDCQSLKLMPPVVAPPDLPAPASCRCFCACARRLLTTESSRRWLPTSIRRCSGASSSASSSRLGSASWLLPSSSATLISLLANFTAQLEAAASCPPSAWSMSVSRMPLFCLSGWQSLILLMPSALDAVVGDAVSHGDRPAEDSAGQFHNHCPPGASRQSKRGAHGEAQQQGEADESHGLSPAGLNAGHEADDGEAVHRDQAEQEGG
uniref:PH domain-containing protein n=1 Tax=Macrostomum lignano TaxID=282301 RepID=A0A1I8HDF9_9PLAT